MKNGTVEVSKTETQLLHVSLIPSIITHIRNSLTLLDHPTSKKSIMYI